jgi:arylsulfatase A-like enzyme
MASELDLFPTFVHLAGGAVPADRPMDGYDLLPWLQGRTASPRRELFYLQGARPEAVREDAWKLRIEAPPARGGAASPSGVVELYNLDRDPGERLDVANEHPEIVARLRGRLEAFEASLH